MGTRAHLCEVDGLEGELAEALAAVDGGLICAGDTTSAELAADAVLRACVTGSARVVERDGEEGVAMKTDLEVCVCKRVSARVARWSVL